MPTLKHAHKLKKHRYPTGSEVFFCTLPDCHFKIDVEFAVGKRVICNICNDEFIMNVRSLRLKLPHCEKCGKVKIKDAQGNDRYVKKVGNKILLNVAAESAQNLHDRLASIVRNEADEDI